MNRKYNLARKRLPAAISGALTMAIAAASPIAFAQEEPETPAEQTDTQPSQPMEEVVVLQRLKTAAEDLVFEKQEEAFVADKLGIEQISRAGDSDLGSALRRVTGLTLVDGKFIYVRGLGERYSSTQLNGAAVPSPDLSRNVIPLDLFPANVVSSLSIQKSYSPDMPAAFGGGDIDIRTRSIPNEFIFNIEAGTGWNSNSSDDAITYNGGDDDNFGTDDGTRALSSQIKQAIATYRGNISAFNIQQTLNFDGTQHTFEEGQAINRELATALNRNVELKDKSLSPDIDLKGTIGNNWFISDDLELGAIGIFAYSNEWRNRNQIRRAAFPDGGDVGAGGFLTEEDITRTVQEVEMTGAANFGVRYQDDHFIETSSLFLRNTQDEALDTIGESIDVNQAVGLQRHDTEIRYEERELFVNQIRGEHAFPDYWGIEGNWFYSDATAKSDIPNEVKIEGIDDIDNQTGAIIQRKVLESATAASYRFQELEDEVESYGFEASLPLSFSRAELTLTGGYEYNRKARDYAGLTVNIDTAGANLAALDGSISEVFSDDNILDPDNRFETTLGSGKPESYLAAQTTESGFFMFDLYWGDNWRFTGGVRSEQFMQVSIPIDDLDFENGPSREVIESGSFSEDDIYPAFSMTYIHNDEFQLRFGYGRTTVRPDLREVTDIEYIDPQTRFRVSGNPSLITSQLDNFDIRAEWYLASGDNYSVGLFYKDITDPIERIETFRTEADVILGYLNAVEAEIYGVEFEALKDLASIHDAFEGFFFSGNLTFSDSEITVGENDIGLTNNERNLTGHSDYVANLQLGFDSGDGLHSASLVYNVFGERVFFAGRNGVDDAVEQPFHSLDLIYSFYPGLNSSIKVKVQNLLGEEVVIEQGLEGEKNFDIFEEEVGTTVSVSYSWEF
ncbi:TonB-dependent receptor domain-containing protein [Exilibacterium tricleocarpae]|nr:TonB-dependent receptor [Exilibacterium tricleocarpae]